MKSATVFLPFDSGFEPVDVPSPKFFSTAPEKSTEVPVVSAITSLRSSMRYELATSVVMQIESLSVPEGTEKFADAMFQRPSVSPPANT